MYVTTCGWISCMVQSDMIMQKFMKTKVIYMLPWMYKDKMWMHVYMYKPSNMIYNCRHNWHD